MLRYSLTRIYDGGVGQAQDGQLKILNLFAALVKFVVNAPSGDRLSRRNYIFSGQKCSGNLLQY